MKPRPGLKIIIKEEEIQKRVEAMAGEIARIIPTEGAVMVGVLKGAFVFFTDLLRALSRQGVPLDLDFMLISSYGDGTVSSGDVQLKMDVNVDLRGRVVLLLDDIMDTGRTLAFAKNQLEKSGALKVVTIALLDKPERREVDVIPDFVGFQVPNQFVVGYGVDYANKYRELPYIAILEEIKTWNQ